MDVLDLETGETYHLQVNSETGEEEVAPAKVTAIPKRPFRIPHEADDIDDRNQKLQEKLEKTLRKSRLSAATIVFLLPTTIFFNPVLAIVLVMLEIILHIWAHKKNKKLKDKSMCYYQSPLHIICKEFCATCRDENAKIKITKIQDKRNDKILKYSLEYVRRVVT